MTQKLAVIFLFVLSLSTIALPAVELEAAFDGETVSGTATLTLTAASGDELWLYLPANRDADEGFRQPVEELYLFATNEGGRYPFNPAMEISSLTVNDESIADYTIDGIRLRIPLMESLTVDGAITVTLEFSVRVPEFRQHWGSGDGYTVLAGWHPQSWPMGEDGEYLDAETLPWAVFPAALTDYHWRLDVPDGWWLANGRSDDFSEQRCRGLDLLLLTEESLNGVDEEIWSGQAVKLIDLTAGAGRKSNSEMGFVDALMGASGAGDLHLIREGWDRYSDWFGPLERGLTVVACDAPIYGVECYDGLLLLGALDKPPIVLADKLIYLRQLALQWFWSEQAVDSFETPFLSEGLAHWAARRALLDIKGEGKDLIPVELLGIDQDILSRTLRHDFLYSGQHQPALAAANQFNQTLTYHIGIREQGSQALIEWSRRWSEDELTTAVREYLQGDLATIDGLFTALANRVGGEPTLELLTALGGETSAYVVGETLLEPNGVEPPGFEFRILPDALDPEAWTLFFTPYPWVEPDGSWTLGGALWGRRGVHLLPLEVWGNDDLFLVGSYNTTHHNVNLLGQFSTRFDEILPFWRVGLAGYTRHDETGATLLTSFEFGEHIGRAPAAKLSGGFNYAHLTWGRPERPFTTTGWEGRQLSFFLKLYLDGRSKLGGAELLAHLELASDPFPARNPEHPAVEYAKLLLTAQEELRIAPWLRLRGRFSLGQIFGSAPPQRQLELGEKSAPYEYYLIKQPIDTNMRGYSSRNLTGDAVGCLAGELVFPIGGPLEPALFYDLGAYGDKATDFLTSPEQWLQSAGLTIRLNMTSTVFAELNLPLWVNHPWDDEGQPYPDKWDLRFDFDVRASF